MRINWASPAVRHTLIVLCFGSFVIAWPIVANLLLDSMPGVRPTDDDMASTETTVGIIFVGIFMGMHAASMINEQTLWLRSKWKRVAFLILSTLFAASITHDITTGSIHDQQGPAAYSRLYFFAVQVLPLLWCVFNLHGAAWAKALARRRNRVR